MDSPDPADPDPHAAPASHPPPHLLQTIPLSYARRTGPRETFIGGIFFAWMGLSIWPLFILWFGTIFNEILGRAAVYLGIPLAFAGTLQSCLLITRWDRRVHTLNSQGILIGAWSFFGMTIVAGIWALLLM